MTDYMTPSAELRARMALEKYGFRHVHALGQNFLLDENLLGGLLDAADVRPEDNVLEIGPGAGVMTRLLARRAAKVLAVEVDKNLLPVLEDVLEGEANVRVVHADFMKADLPALVGEAFGDAPYRVVANLPYYITADILLKLVLSPRKPESIAIMVQREAAERILAEPGTKPWCALAATIRYFGDARVLTEVPPEAFDPPPHVVSCFMRIDLHREKPVRPRDERTFLRLVNAAFAMRRKTLVNNLKAGFGLSAQEATALLEDAGEDARVRGEALSLEALCRVSDALTERGIGIRE